MRRRIVFVCVMFSTFLILLMVRVAYIQLDGYEDLAAAATRQHRVGLEGIDSRGIVYDRNKEPLTGREKEFVYVISRERFDKRAEEIFRKINGRRVPSNNNKYHVYSTGKYRDKESYLLQQYYGAYIVETEKRYDENQIAPHVIGYLNQIDNKGASGLEYMYDQELSKRKKTLFAVADARGDIINGIGLQTDVENRDLGIVTTLDAQLQKFTEKAMEDNEINGAAIILSSKMGEILACASTPKFNPNNIKDYINSDNKELIDKATQGEYPPGSVFKIVVVAAALENSVATGQGEVITQNTRFNCKGFEEINGIKIGCLTGGEKGHGTISLKDAFAHSCNSTFIQIGMLTGGDKILEMAQKMGIGEKAMEGFPNIKNGSLPTLDEIQGAGIGNLSIGQGKVETTPMQIARLTNIIANGGIDKGLILVKGMTEREHGQIVIKEARGIKGKLEKMVLSQETAAVIKEMMISVMDYGSGKGGSYEDVAAGKTGSAESTQMGKEVVHGWFTGFYPAENPIYTITVFVEGGKSGRGAALPIFEEIVNKIEKEWPEKRMTG